MLRRSATLQWQFQSLRAAKPSEQNGAQTATLPTLPSFVSGWVQGIKSILSDLDATLCCAGGQGGDQEHRVRGVRCEPDQLHAGRQPQQLQLCDRLRGLFPQAATPQGVKISLSLKGFFGSPSSSGCCLCLPSCRVHLGNLQQHWDRQPSPVERGLGGNCQNANSTDGKSWCSLIVLMFLKIGFALKYYWWYQ